MKTAQEQAIEKTTGPCIIRAGAGTGKTYTSVQKVKHLIESNTCKPEEILCLTFSNEAKNELRHRLSELIAHGSDIAVNNFHGFCADVLKEFGNMIDVPQDFEILPPEDAKVLFHRYLDITPHWAGRYVGTIGTASSFGISLKDLQQKVVELKEGFNGIGDVEAKYQEIKHHFSLLHLEPQETKEQRKEVRDKKKQYKEFLEKYKKYEEIAKFAFAWEKYEELKASKNYLDYGDLTLFALDYFRKFGADKVASQYKHVFVDEFQDTNKLQFELIEFLAKDHRNITVVGDPNQSIYGFRGSYKESFEHFKQVFNVDSNTDEFTLDKTRRSPNTVLRVAHKLIQKNWENPEECFFVEHFEGKEGTPVECYNLVNADEEARKIAEIVEEAIENGTAPEEIAILIRTHRQAKPIERALKAKAINYVSAGQIDLLKRPEIKTVISYLAILNNLRHRKGTGEQAWWNLFHYHNALSPRDSVKIGRYLKKHRKEDVSIDEVLLSKIDEVDISESGKKIADRVFATLQKISKVGHYSLTQLVLKIYEISGLNRAFSHTRSAENVEAMMNLREFFHLTERYTQTHGKDLDQFIAYLETLEELDVTIPASSVSNVSAVRLMTMHATKGLQFDLVIVSNMADRRFPMTRTPNEPLLPKELMPEHAKILSELEDGQDPTKAIKEFEKEQLEIDERRLAYVAFTRTKDRLVLTFASSYNSEKDSASPSVFLQEVDFKENPDINVIVEDEEKSMLFAPSSKLEQFKAMLKSQFIEALDREEFDSLLQRLGMYYAVRQGEPISQVKEVTFDTKQMKANIAMFQNGESGMKFNPYALNFSPSSLLEYEECPKKFELGRILNMPQISDLNGKPSASLAGSFVHQVLEDGIRDDLESFEEFEKLARKLHTQEYKSVDLEAALPLIKIGFERFDKTGVSKVLVEEGLPLDIDGLRFFGFADRIDLHEDGTCTIVDYKTNSGKIDTKKRAWQLGYYALAAQAKGFKPKRLVLDMLKHEKPVAMLVDGDKVTGEGRTRGDFKLSELKQEMLDSAKKIIKDYETEFKWVEDDNPCKFCGFKFYCPKWEETK